MAHQYWLSYGTTTLPLTVVSYSPTVPAGDEQTVREIMRVQISGASRAAWQAAYQALGLAENAAKARKLLQRGDRLYLVVLWDGYADAYRSELTLFCPSPSVNVVTYQWASLVTEVEIVLERTAWWEDNTERQISLTNTNGTDDTAGLNVYNCNDGSGAPPNDRVNYVEITAAKVAGDLPAPAKIKFTNASAISIAEMFISHNWRSDPANFTHWYDLNVTADGTCSGGGYTAFTSGLSTPSTALLYATISSAQVSKLLGRHYRVLARLQNFPPTDYIFKPTVYGLAGTKYYGPAMLLGAQPTDEYLFDFGQLPVIPPQESAGDTIGAFDFGVWVENMPASTLIDVDYLQITPVDGYRNIRGIGVAQNYELVLDELTGECKYFNATPALYGYGVARGTPILLQPNTLQRLYFLWNEAAVNTVSAYGTVKVYYRPRRRSL